MKNLFLLLIFFVCYIKCATTNSSYNESVFPFILQYLEENKSDMCYIFNCWEKQEIVKFDKMLSKSYIRTAFVTSLNGIRESLTEKYVIKSCYVLDLSCKKFENLLETAASPLNFRRTFPWLVLTESTNFSPEFWQKKLEKIEIRLDSKFRIAIPVQSANDTSYEILDVYNPGLKIGGKPIVKKIGYWNYNKGLQIGKSLSFYSDRKIISSITIRSATVILAPNFTGNAQEFLLDGKEETVDQVSKYYYQIWMHLQEIHHFSHNLTITNRFTGLKRSGIDAGVAKLLHEDKADIGITGTCQLYPEARIPVTDYLMPTFPVKTVFVFRNPGVYDPFTNEFLQPFSTTTWYVVLVSALIICILLKAAFRVESKYLQLETNYSWTTAILTTISAFFQQGSSISPEYFAGRLIFLILFLFSFLLYNYYTSCILSSLLSKPPDTLKNLYDLGHSNLEIAIENAPYAITWLQVHNSSDMQYLHHRVLKRDLTYNIYTVKDGLDRVREGQLAYHALCEIAYFAIAKTFDQDAICDFHEITLIPPCLAAFTIQKKSQYAEMFHVSLRKIYAAGIIRRNLLIWVTKKPECLSSSIVKAVSIEQTVIAFLCLISGIISALIALIIEIIWFRFKLDNKFN